VAHSPKLDGDGMVNSEHSNSWACILRATVLNRRWDLRAFTVLVERRMAPGLIVQCGHVRQS